MRILKYTVTDEYDGFKLEDYLIKAHGFSRRIITKLKQKRGFITLNAEHIRMVDLIRCNDEIAVTFEDVPHLSQNSSLVVPVVYEDDDIIVFNKPADMPVHPSGKHQSDTLANVFAYLSAQKGENHIFRPINRLDRDTTGLCVVAKNALVAATLWKSIEKEYTAIACGYVIPDEGKIDAPIYRPDECFTKRVVDDRGKRAITNFTVVKRMNNYTLLCIKLETGRTHQIRVHFANMGFPLAGDSMYGGSTSDIKRQALSCTKVRFLHPITKKNVYLCINIPEDMRKLVENE
ncbi:MAG: RluA family pseudouridine synthase [Oscillospiraceae bacterium]